MNLYVCVVSIVERYDNFAINVGVTVILLLHTLLVLILYVCFNGIHGNAAVDVDWIHGGQITQLSHHLDRDLLDNPSLSLVVADLIALNAQSLNEGDKIRLGEEVARGQAVDQGAEEGGGLEEGGGELGAEFNKNASVAAQDTDLFGFGWDCLEGIRRGRGYMLHLHQSQIRRMKVIIGTTSQTERKFEAHSLVSQF